jgi:ribonuclease HI
MEQVYKNHMKIFTDGPLKENRVGHAVITPESTTTEQMRQQTTIFSAEQEAVIKAIYFAKKKKKRALTATESLYVGNGMQSNDPNPDVSESSWTRQMV